MTEPKPAYSGDEPFIFVCYAHQDNDLTYPEIRRLQDAGFNLWYDDGITPGSEWSAAIASAIERCSVFLYLITPNSVASEHCRQEVNYALEQRCTMLALHLEATDVPGALKLSLSHRQAILKYKDRRYADKLDAVLAEALGHERGDIFAARQLQIGEFLLDIDAHTLSGPNGAADLDPKDISVLLHLAELAPAVISTEDILNRSWPGVVVGDNVIHQVISRLRKAFNDDARESKYIATIPRQGYRLLEPAEPAENDREIITSRGAETPPKNRGRLGTLVGIVGVVVLVFLWLWQTLNVTDTPEEIEGESVEVSLIQPLPDYDIDSVVLLPIDMSNRLDPAFSKLGSVLFNSIDLALAEADRPILRSSQRVEELLAGGLTPHDAAQNVEAGYFVELRLRPAGDDAQIGVKITRSWNDSVLWSNTYNRPLIELLQDPSSVVPHLDRNIRFRIARDTDDQMVLRRYGNTDAGFYFVSGWQIYRDYAAGFGGDWNLITEHYRKAVDLDPSFSLAQALLANSYRVRAGVDIPVDNARSMAKAAIATAHRFSPLHDDVDLLLQSAEIALHLDLDYERGEYELDRIIELAPDFNYSYYHLALMHLMEGHIPKARSMINASERFDYLGEQLGVDRSFGTRRYYLGQYRAAIEHWKNGQSIADQPRILSEFLRLQALAHVQLGELDRANDLVSEAWALTGDREPHHFIEAYAMIGNLQKARELLPAWPTDHIPFDDWSPFDTYYFRAVRTYFALGDYDKALDALRKGIDTRQWDVLMLIRSAKFLEPLRAHPGFADVLAHLEAEEAKAKQWRLPHEKVPGVIE